MRNLKKLLAVVLTVVMIASMMVPALAANTYEDEALKLQAINVFAGGPEDLKLDEGVTRIQGLTFAIRAAGKDAEALAMDTAEVDAILADWTDADSIPAWGRKYAAYAIKNSITVGLSSTEKIFGALNPISGTSFLVFIMKAGMGYADVTTANVVEASVDAGILTVGQAVGFGANEALIRDDAAGILFGAFTTGVNADGTSLLDAYIASGATTAAEAAAAGFVSSATLAVESIAATSAKTFLVKFNKAVTDDDKVTFEVKRLTTTTSVTVTWNDAKTEATLTGASNFAESDYTVRVLKDGEQIASETISITPQKIAQIEFTSPSVTVTIGSNTGYVTYKVYDQYGNDITTTSKANSLSYQTSVGTAEIKNGLMKITSENPSLAMIQNLTVVLYDASTGISSTAALPISTTAGTLSDFQFNLTDNLTIKEGDNTTVYYIPYVAKDMAGNETKDYDLITGGLIDANKTSTTDNEVNLVVSLNNKVSATIVKDPSNSKLAAVEVKYIGEKSDLVMDMPVTITAMTLTGKTSVAQLTLAKAKAVDSLVLLAPAETVAAGETPEIPFEAYDQYGNRVTSYADINAGVTNANGFTIKEKSDGTAKFVMEKLDNKGIKSLSATLKSGKVSNILNINVQDAAKPASIAIARADFISAMEQTATQSLNIGNDTAKDELRVYDQYDRLMNDEKIMSFIGGTKPTHKITVTLTGDIELVKDDTTTTQAIDLAKGTDDKTVKDLTLTAKNVDGGSGKIEVKLIELGETADKDLDTVSTPISVVKTGDITSYTINTADAEKVLYAATERKDKDPLAPTARDNEYAYTAKVYGRTDAGTQVLLADKPIVASSITNGDDFAVTSVTDYPVAYNGVKVTAAKLNNNRTEASTDLVITVAHNNTVKPLTVTLKSSTAAPVANEIKLKGADGDGLVADVVAGKYLIQKYAPAEVDTTPTTTETTKEGALTKSSFYFYIADSYGKEGMTFVSFRIAKAKVKVKDADTGTDTDKIVSADKYNGASIENNGLLTINADAKTGDVIYVTAVTNNGRSATMMIQVQ